MFYPLTFFQRLSCKSSALSALISRVFNAFFTSFQQFKPGSKAKKHCNRAVHLKRTQLENCLRFLLTLIIKQWSPLDNISHYLLKRGIVSVMVFLALASMKFWHLLVVNSLCFSDLLKLCKNCAEILKRWIYVSYVLRNCWISVRNVLKVLKVFLEVLK